jgi:TonB family protein
LNSCTSGSKKHKSIPEVYINASDKLLQFPVEDGNVIKYVTKHLHYPVTSQLNGISGRVICKFTVEEDGKITDATVVMGVCPELDKEALRIIRNMPDWQPWKTSKKTERIKYTLPVDFWLQNTIKANDNVFTIVEEMPEFIAEGGDLSKYITTHLRYPDEAKKDGIQGRVICQFVVTETGILIDIQVIRGVDPSFDKEAVSIIMNMPRWKPGRQMNQIVKVKYILPVNFRLH